MTACDAQKSLKAQMAQIDIKAANGTQFYEHLFTVAPPFQQFFKGSENLAPKDIHTSERFHKQGVRLLTSVRVSVQLMCAPEEFDAYVRDIADKHRRYKTITMDEYKQFFTVFGMFVEKFLKRKNTAEETAAWQQLDKMWMCSWQKYWDELNLK